MRNLVKIHNTGDVRWLLYEYDKDYPLTDLMPVYDEIMQEYEKLSGGNNYQRHLEESDSYLWEIDLLYAIELTRRCLRIIDLNTNTVKIDTANKLIDSFNLRLDGKKINVTTENLDESDKKLERLYKSINSRLEIKKIKSKEEKNINKMTINWTKIQVRLEYKLKRTIPDDITVSKYLEYDNISKELERNA